MIYVQFFDATEQKITSVFGCPQDPGVWPFQGSVEASDVRYKTYYESLSGDGLAGLPQPE